MSKIKETNKTQVTKLNESVRIVINKDDQSTMIEPITVPDLLKQIAENYGSNMALMYKETMTSEEWKGITYKEYRERVIRTAKTFMKLGLEKHDVVAILAFNSVEWFISGMAAIHAGGIITGIYTTNSVDACRHILESSKAKIVIVDDAKQMEKIHKLKKKLPYLKIVIQTLPPFAIYVNKEDCYWRWNELDHVDISDMDEMYQKRSSEIYANECCCLIYTSGTITLPKAAMISHDNCTFNVNAVKTRISNFDMGKESLVSYLPLSHVAGLAVDMFLMLKIAATVYFADCDALKGTLVNTLLSAQPTLLMGVPRVYEKMHEKMLSVAAESGMVKKMIGNWAKSVTLQHHMDRMSGNFSNYSIQYELATRIVISKVKQALGLNRIKYMSNGAAPINIETKKYFLSLDMPILDVYGMSETCGAHTLTTLTPRSLETSGQPLPGMMIKIHNPNDEGHGEVCFKGRNVFMGYLNDEEKTREAIDDEGWLHSGDYGYIDNEGDLYLTGRLKELIITAGGENIPTLFIENSVKNECPALSNAFLVGDKKKYLTILLTLKTEMNDDGVPMDALAPATLKWLQGMNLSYTKLSQVLSPEPDEIVKQALTDVIMKVNEKSISNAQKIKKFAILPHDFSISTGELGPSMKVKRNIVIEIYKNIIENLYK